MKTLFCITLIFLVKGSLIAAEVPRATKFIGFDDEKMTIVWTTTPQEAQRLGFRRFPDLDKTDYYVYTARGGTFHLFFKRKNNVLAYCIVNDPVKDKIQPAKRLSAAFAANITANLKNENVFKIEFPDLKGDNYLYNYSALVHQGNMTLVFFLGVIGNSTLTQIRVYNPAVFPPTVDFVRNNYKNM